MEYYVYKGAWRCLKDFMLIHMLLSEAGETGQLQGLSFLLSPSTTSSNVWHFCTTSQPDPHKPFKNLGLLSQGEARIRCTQGFHQSPQKAKITGCEAQAQRLYLSSETLQYKPGNRQGQREGEIPIGLLTSAQPATTTEHFRDKGAEDWSSLCQAISLSFFLCR